MLHQGQAQPAAFRVVNQRITYAIKLLENLVLLVGRYTNAVVDHFKFHGSIFAIQVDADVLAVLRILQGVIYEVDEGACHRLAIHPQRWNIADFLLESESVLLNLITVGLQRIAHQLGQIGLAEVIFFAASLDAGEIKDVIDQRSETLTLFTDDAVILLVLVRAGEAP